MRPISNDSRGAQPLKNSGRREFRSVDTDDRDGVQRFLHCRMQRRIATALGVAFLIQLFAKVNPGDASRW
jgi:hypothetical protein